MSREETMVQRVRVLSIHIRHMQDYAQELVRYIPEEFRDAEFQIILDGLMKEPPQEGE